METPKASEFNFNTKKKRSDRKKMDDLEKFLIKKLDNAIEDTKDYVMSGCLRKDFNHLRDWIEKNKNKIDPTRLKEKLYFLNNVIAEWQMVLKKQKCYFDPQTIWIACNVHRSIKKIENELLEDGHDASTEDGNRTLESDRWNSHSVDETKIYGIDDELMVMERLLVGEERKVGFEVIPIVGGIGVGKTSFCQVTFNNPKVREIFSPRIWVYMSEQSMKGKDYKKEVVKNILMGLGYEEKLIDQIGDKEPDGLRRLLSALRQKLKSKKYLIVLDGDWNLDEKLTDFCSSLINDDNVEDQIAYGFPKGYGGTVITSCRSKTLAAHKFGEKKLRRLLPSDDEESSWKVFKDTVGKNLKDDMTNLKAEIVKICAGLPLVAKMLGLTYLIQDQKSPREADLTSLGHV